MKTKQQFASFKTYDFRKDLLEQPIDHFWPKLATNKWQHTGEQIVHFDKLAIFITKLIILPTSTAQVEKDFSSMTYVKTKKEIDSSQSF